MYFQSAIAVFLSLLVSAMAVSNYEGEYRLIKVIDTEMGDIPVPKGEFKIQMQPGKIANQYDMSIKLGNSLGTSVTVSDYADDAKKDAVTIGGVRSTMMMPPENIFRVEVALTNMLPAATLIFLENDLLAIEGPKGTIMCTRFVV